MKLRTRLAAILFVLLLIAQLSGTAGAVPEETVSTPAYQITLSSEKLDLKVGASKQLKATTAPKLPKGEKLIWLSSDEAIATVSKGGMVKAVGPGTCVISAALESDAAISASCEVKVTKLITSLKPKVKSVSVLAGDMVGLLCDILPSDASNKTLSWLSSDNKIARVLPTGVVHGLSAGKCTITASTNDGSKKKATFTVFVTSIKAARTDYQISSKSPIKIPVSFYGNEISYTYTSSNFEVEWAENWRGSEIDLIVHPLRTGTGKIKVFDTAYKASSVEITVTVGKGAVYDEQGYPRLSYESVARYPSSYRGDPVHIKGKVVQVMKSGGETILRVATRGSYRDVVYVTIPSTVQTIGNVLEDDQVTIFGLCTGVHSYTTIMGGEVTIPSMKAEKVIIR